MSEQIILETRNLTKGFKGFTAVDRVNLQIQRGHIHALKQRWKTVQVNVSDSRLLHRLYLEQMLLYFHYQETRLVQ